MRKTIFTLIIVLLLANLAAAECKSPCVQCKPEMEIIVLPTSPNDILTFTLDPHTEHSIVIIPTKRAIVGTQAAVSYTTTTTTPTTRYTTTTTPYTTYTTTTTPTTRYTTTTLPINPPVLTLDTYHLTINEGETANIVASCTDPDMGDSVLVTFSGWMTQPSRQTGYDDAGTYSFLVKCADTQGHVVYQDAKVTVLNMNRPPSISWQNE